MIIIFSIWALFFNDSTYYLGTFFFGLLVCVGISFALGDISIVLARNREFSDTKAFWLGFITWIGILIVVTRPRLEKRTKTNDVRILPQKEDEIILENGGWKCIKCGKANQNYIGTCTCGMQKMDSKELEIIQKAQIEEYLANKEQQKMDEFSSNESYIRAHNYVVPDGKDWECIGCGRINPAYAKTCSFCGKIKVYNQSVIKEKATTPKIRRPEESLLRENSTYRQNALKDKKNYH